MEWEPPRASPRSFVAGDQGQHLAPAAFVVQRPAPWNGHLGQHQSSHRLAGEQVLRQLAGGHAREPYEVGPGRIGLDALLKFARGPGRRIVRGDDDIADDGVKPLVDILPGCGGGGGVPRHGRQRLLDVLMMGDRGAVRQQQRADHRGRDELGVMAVLPVQLLPDRGDLTVVLEVGQAVVPVAGEGDLFGKEPAAVLQPAFADDGLEARHAQIGAQREVVLPRADEDDVPVFVYGHSLTIFLRLECPSTSLR